MPDAVRDGAAVEPAVRAELARIAGRFEAASKRRRLAGLCAETQSEYAAEMDEAAAEFWAAGDRLADLLLLLLRYGLRHRREQLHALLAESLAPELESLAKALVRGRR